LSGAVAPDIKEKHEARVSQDTLALSKLNRWQIAALASICLAAVGGRILFAWWSLPPLESDFSWYRRAGLAAAHHGILSLFSSDPPVPIWVLSLWPPGYPFFLGLLYSVDSNIWLAPITQAVLSGFMCFIVFRTARRWGGNPWAAAAIVAFYPQAIVYSAIHGAETLTIFLLSLAAMAAVSSLRSRQAALYGLALGLTILTRCHAMLLAPGVIASLWRRWSTLAVLIVCALLVLLPWAVSRSSIYHRPVLMTTFFGHLLYMGNHIDNTTGGYYEAPRPAEIPSGVTAPEEDIYFLAAGLREILLHPGHYLLLTSRRALIWTGIEKDEWIDKYAPEWLGGLSLIAQLILFLAALAATIEIWKDPRSGILLWPAVSLVILTSLSYHMPRYTLVALPYFALIASKLSMNYTKPTLS